MKHFIIPFLLCLLFASAAFSQETTKAPAEQPPAEAPGPYDFGMGAVFGAVSINGKNYQQIGLRPEIKLWKLGIGLAEGVSVDIKYLITFEDKNGDGKIRGDEETITNVSVSTSALF